jgi:hypothetical protein
VQHRHCLLSVIDRIAECKYVESEQIKAREREKVGGREEKRGEEDIPMRGEESNGRLKMMT